MEVWLVRWMEEKMMMMIVVVVHKHNPDELLVDSGTLPEQSNSNA